MWNPREYQPLPSRQLRSPCLLASLLFLVVASPAWAQPEAESDREILFAEELDDDLFAEELEDDEPSVVGE